MVIRITVVRITAMAMAISLTQIQTQNRGQLYAGPLEKAPDKQQTTVWGGACAGIVDQELCKSECFLSSQTYNMQSRMGGRHPSYNLLQIGSFY